MKSFSGYKTIYYVGIVFIVLGGIRLLNHLSYGEILFAIGVLLYSGVQIRFLFYKSIADWWTFDYLKLSVNFLFLISIFLLFVIDFKLWYYPFVLGLLVDFFANILRRIKRT
ncbi:hypothetical protein [Labilibaculum sp.]|uniref:hypothetical protein n=1 Tax=Labilibaculum sp. TaxID=2060723 RepID=UPI002AA8BEFB|nr:hypothetical protein [Labilibaculum sp.]MBN2595931.1 hypothetical protein [Marinifilaceae bacterium]